MRLKQAGLLAFTILAVIGCAAAPEPIDGLVAINGTELYVKTMGDGDPILVVHGGPGWDHSYFLPQLGELAEDHRLVFYDQRLSGRSPGDLDPSEISLSLLVEDIEGLRQHLGIEKLRLLAHSYGGRLALEYAVKYPANLDSLILLNSNAASSEFSDAARARLAERFTPDLQQRQQELASSEAFQSGDASAFTAMMKLMIASNFHDPSQVDALNLTFPADIRTRGERMQQGMSADMAPYDLHPQLASVDCPTLILHGSAELLPVEASEKMRDAFPNARLELLENCGHFPFIECPDQLFTAVRTFLSEG